MQQQQQAREQQAEEQELELGQEQAEEVSLAKQLCGAPARPSQARRSSRSSSDREQGGIAGMSIHALCRSLGSMSDTAECRRHSAQAARRTEASA